MVRAGDDKCLVETLRKRSGWPLTQKQVANCKVNNISSMSEVTESVPNFENEEEEKLSAVLAQLDLVSVLEAKEIYDSLVQAYPTTLGKSISKKERDEFGLKDSTLVYGEMSFDTFGMIFEKIKKIYGKPNVGSSGPSGILQSRGGIFYDLGSGTGKAVIAASVLHNFDVCYGIEILEGLYSVSLDALNTYNTRGKAKLSSRDNDTRKIRSLFARS